MEIDLSDLTPFTTWFPGALKEFLGTLLIFGLVVIPLGWIIAMIRCGPSRGTEMTISVLGGGIVDLLRLSPRRVFALTWLAIKESIRRRVVVVVALFAVALLFAGWFIDTDSSNPAQVYLSFVLTATSYLIMILVWILCSLSLPTDLKNRTLHTIVTKPVRPSEIILGRILGFAAMGTGLLLIMGAISYIFVERGLAHTHSFDADDLKAVAGSTDEQPVRSAKSGNTQKHRHDVLVYADSSATVELSRGHIHAIKVVQSGPKTQYLIGAPEGDLIARVPIYGKISFLNRAGEPTEKGINVGKENSYRSYIEGGTQSAAIWTFQNVSEDRFPDGLPVAMHLSVFRTYSGIIDKGIPGSLWLWNPKTEKWVRALGFTAKDAIIDMQTIPQEVLTSDGKKLDLFEDFVANGEIKIQLRCESPAQCFGVAQPDLYLRSPDASFFLNFFKGYLGIWMQMMLLISIGVFLSTFLSGPVALLSTAGLAVGGLCYRMIFEMASGQTITGGQLYGGGPFESLVRLFTQENITSVMEPGLRTTVVKSLDLVFQQVLVVVSKFLPDFVHYSYADYVANGFNIPTELLLKYLCRAAAFVVPVFVASYFCFKMREVAK